MSLLPRLTRAAAALALGVTAAVAMPGAAPVSAIPALGPVITLTAQPESMVLGPDGNMWVVLSGSPTNDDVAKVTPAGVPTYYDLPAVASLGDITVGSDGNLWATLATGVVKIPPANPVGATATPLVGFAEARGITAGLDGNLYAGSGSKLFRIPPASPATATNVDVAGMAAREVATASDGRIWVADFNGRAISFSPVDLSSVPHTVTGNLQGIASGPAGQVLYSNPGSNPQSIGRLVLNGTPQVTPVGPTDPSFSIAFAADQAYWVGLFNTGQVLRVTPEGVVTTYGTYPATQKPRHLATGPAGTVWVSLQNPGNPGAIGIVTGVTAPVVVPPPPADSTALVGIGKARITITTKAGRTGRGSVRITCPAAEISGPCTGTVRLKAATKPRSGLATSASYSLAAGASTKVRLRLKAGALRRLRAAGGSLPVTVVATVSDTRGNQARVIQASRLRLR